MNMTMTSITAPYQISAPIKPGFDALHMVSKVPICEKEELSSLTPTHSQIASTSFPVNLKEVFELTSPELNTTILRQRSDLGEYMISSDLLLMPKTIDKVNGVKIPVRGEVICLNEPNQISVQQSLNWKDSCVHTPQDPWTGVSRIYGKSDKKLDSNIVDLNVENSSQPQHVQMPLNEPLNGNINLESYETWSSVIKEGTNIEPSERVFSHVVQDSCMDRYEPQSPKVHVPSRQAESWSYSSEREGPSSETDYGKRDVSCQVNDSSLSPKSSPHIEDVSLSFGKLDNTKGSRQNSLARLPSKMPNGIKPEMYVLERNLLVEQRLKNTLNPRKAGLFPCRRCDKAFADGRSLQRHMHIHTSARAYRCQVCKKGFMLKGDLNRHIRIHSGERPYSCDVCNRRFTLKGNLMQHFRTHAPDKQYSCTICAKTYAQKDSLHRHIRSHFGDKPFHCAICGKRFTLKGDLSRHILIHSGARPHMCEFCGRTFALKGNLNQHMRIHIKNKPCEEGDEKNYQDLSDVTSNCQTSYLPSHASLSTIKDPEDKIGPNTVISYNKPSFVPAQSHCNVPQSPGLAFCSACSETFSSPECLQEHVQLVHERPSHNMSRYLCNLCQKQFTLKGDLTRHINSHNGVKPYQCSLCEKTFTLKSNLRQHQTTHVSDKSYSCPLCSKMFGNRRNLSLHLRRHEQANVNFSCTKCGRSFLAKSDHFFHNCSKSEPVTTASTTLTAPEVSKSKSNDSSHLKQEVVQTMCRSQEMAQVVGHDGTVNVALHSNESILNPFYRHLYFATSHQSVLPGFKGFIHVQSEENNVYEKTAKKS